MKCCADRDKTIDALEKHIENYVPCCSTDVRDLDLFKAALELLKEQQKQIDSMNFIYGFVYGGQVKEIKELVRCKDCKHVCMCDTTEMLPDIPIYAKCTLTDEVHEPDWFCADGERQEVK